MINELKTLNNLHRRYNLGVFKKWILKSKTDFNKVCDYLEKIGFCIQDLNEELTVKKIYIKDIVYIVILTVWIQEAFEKLMTLYNDDVIDKFTFNKADELAKARKYINAVRSFVVAHPLSTDRHDKYEFDGNYICVDVRTPSQDTTFPSIKKEQFHHLDFNGIYDNGRNPLDDFFLYCYSTKHDNMRFYQYIGCSLSDIYHVAELYIEKLYLLDKYLSKQKKYDYKVI